MQAALPFDWFVFATRPRTGNNPPAYVAQRLEADQMAGIRYPSDGKLLGDWKQGEQIAQSGRGFT